MFKRVQIFGQTYIVDFATGSVAVTNFGVIGQVITGLDNAKILQKPGDDTAYGVLVHNIRLDVENIARTAKAIDQDQPGFADAFRLPDNYNPGSWLDTADKFIQQLAVQTSDTPAAQAAKAALVAQFVAHEMDANFVAHLQADRAAVTGDAGQREDKRETGVGNTAIIRTLIDQGLKAVNNLDAIMHNKYDSQPDKLAAWLTASHVERATRHATTPAPAPTTATTTTPAPQSETKK